MQSTYGLFMDSVEEGYFNKDELIKVLASWLGSTKLEEMIKHYDWFVPGVNDGPDLEEE